MSHQLNVHVLSDDGGGDRGRTLIGHPHRRWGDDRELVEQTSRTPFVGQFLQSLAVPVIVCDQDGEGAVTQFHVSVPAATSWSRTARWISSRQARMSVRSSYARGTE